MKVRLIVFALAIASLCLADIQNQTVTLQANSTLNLDNGLTGNSGGDLLFTGASLSYQGKAEGSVLGILGANGFNNIFTEGFLKAFPFSSFNTTPITGSALAVDSIAATLTNGGNRGKIWIKAVSNASITVEFSTYGATAIAAPVITKVVNNYSLTVPGFPNAGVSPSELVAVFGSNLGDPPPGALTLNTTAGSGLPTTSAGASATINAGGKIFPLYLYYASPNQMAGVIPAATPIGPATMTVTYQGQTSNPFAFQIVANSLGLASFYATGSGLIVATDALTGTLVDYTHSAIPGRTYVFWGSGAGRDSADSDFQYTLTPSAVNQDVTQMWFGGVLGSVTYSGSSGFPGLNQINVTIPLNVATGCGVSVAGVVNNVSSNFGLLPVDPSGGPCRDSIFGFSGNDLSALGGAAGVKAANLTVGQATQPAPVGTANLTSGVFSSTPGWSYASAGVLALGSCVTSQFGPASGSSGTTTALDVGQVQLTTPTGAVITLQSSTKGSYFGLVPASAFSSTGGTYRFTVGGGADGGGGNGSVVLPNPFLTPANVPTLIDRSKGFQAAWNGGAPGSYVVISGSVSDPATGATGSFLCYAPQSAGTFLVPPYVTGVLPAGAGSLSFQNATLPQKLSLKGLDAAFGFGFNSVGVNVTFN